MDKKEWEQLASLALLYLVNVVLIWIIQGI